MNINRWCRNLLIGHKLALAFGITGLLFLGVVAQYHRALFLTLDAHDTLRNEYGARKDRLVKIEVAMLEARRGEKDFLARKDLKYAKKVDEFVQAARQEAQGLEALREEVGGESGARLAARLRELMESYHASFREIVTAWETQGLDHESGLQGRFRKSVHEVEKILHDFDVAQLVIDLGDMRRSEKDYVVRGKKKYVEGFHAQEASFRRFLAASQLTAPLKVQLSRALDDYAAAFAAYVPARNPDISQQLGEPIYLFISERAHDVEKLLYEHYIPGIWQDMLMMRRHEKDFLLRGQEKYVKKTLEVLEKITKNVHEAAIAKETREVIARNLREYGESFRALVEQTGRIAKISEVMREAVHRMEPVIEAQVAAAVVEMERIEATTREDSKKRSLMALLMAVVAGVLAGVFSVVITRRISGPLGTLNLFASQVAQGDLRVAVDFHQEDEVGQLGRAMTRMVGSLRDLVGKMRDNALELETASGDLASVSTQMRGNAATLLEQSATTAASVEELSATMVQIAASAEEASANLHGIASGSGHAGGEIHAVADAAQETAGVLSQVAEVSEQVTGELNAVVDGARRATHSVESAAVSIQEVNDSFVAVRERCAYADGVSMKAVERIRSSGEVMTHLSNAAHEIGAVVEVITNIAEQTNMLALNASIEAAGAGDAGKGFAVVANEVKELARQTSHATLMIQEQVQSIQQHAGSVAEEVRDVVRLIEGIAQANGEILHAVNAQSSAAESVSLAMDISAGETGEVTSRLGDAAGRIMEISSQIMAVFSSMLNVSNRMSQANQGMTEVAMNVQHASQGAEEITRSVSEAALATSEISRAVAGVNDQARQVEAVTTLLDQRASGMTEMAKLLKELVGQFKA